MWKDVHHLPHPALIPLHGVGITASFIVLQSICKRRSVATEREVIAGIRSQHHRTTHIETVEVALQRSSCHTHGLVLEIVAR